MFWYRKTSRRMLRRHHVARVGSQRRAEHLFFVHGPRGPYPPEPDCVCEQSVFFFAKRGILPCRCSKKTPGRPKIGNGCCYYGKLRPTVVTRRRNRQLCQSLTIGRTDPWTI